MNWIAQLPVGVMYGVLALAGLGLVGLVWLGTYALYKGGRIKFGKAEIDAPDSEDDPPQVETKGGAQ